MHSICFLATMRKYSNTQDFKDASSDASKYQLMLKYFGDASSNIFGRCISKMFWSLNHTRTFLFPYL